MTDTGYSRSPRLLKGAFIQFSAGMILPVPNVIVFQYNPETLSRSFNTFEPKGGDAETAPHATGPKSPERAQPWDPPETISLTLELDATDDLETPLLRPIAFVSGVADKLAALELLLYPEQVADEGLAAAVADTVAGLTGGGGKGQPLTKLQVPVALFVWGPGRIVPVRLSSFTVDEQAFNQLLYPIRAKVTVAMKVLTDADIEAGNAELSTMEEIAAFAYRFTKKQKQVLALANLANEAESTVLDILPLF